jgi:hypothetical protein
MPFDASTDPRLIGLKRIAEGGGDRGPLYDEGVLSVINAILKEGHFVRSRHVGLMVLFVAQRQLTQKLLTSDEEAELQHFIASHGWTFDEASQFLDGVDLVERMLQVYEMRDEPTDRD